MPTCCGSVTWSLWQVVALAGGVIALFTNSWLQPSDYAKLAAPADKAGLWVVCGDEGYEARLDEIRAQAQADPTGVSDRFNELADEFADGFTDSSSWIFNSGNASGCSPLGSSRVEAFYSDLPAGSGKDYWLYVQSTRGLVVAFCILALVLIPVVASHSGSRAGVAGFSHFVVALQVSAGICAVCVYVALLGQVADDAGDLPQLQGDGAGEVLSQLPDAVTSGFGKVANYWGWSFWMFVAATAWALLGWPLLCILFCCTPKPDADGPYYK
eukprot:CAMPEP_0119125398 /NCGR_PEP_ID=MMETSP1310-20130426/4685_1 /TAXON_ID=464262 /ORGANISM="Genus nov. species nov., Strain RCC2339" /LENGTH=269 /DNA_ID=CAMNT_0007115459 /DNA_START=36 /DNA_END=845 /DNA_ORIENTATION=-